MTDSAEALARRFHELYEQLAPEHGYKTREASAVPWDDVPAGNKGLMIQVAARIIAERPLMAYEPVEGETRYYVGCGRTTGRISAQLGPSTFTGPPKPFPLGWWATPRSEDGPLLYPVSKEVHDAWIDDDDDQDDDEDDL